ncbi:MAG: hypothetical protein DHS20C02_18980 [Micavibrio sp.]|nr:MAG: hypothetical protein DHS20C02_18980 [Micavibrio sp.]
MRTLILFTVLIFAIAAPSLAQVDPNAPLPGAADDVPDREGREPERRQPPEAKPEITGIASACARPGDMMAINGRSLSALDGVVPALADNSNVLPLRVLNKSENRLMVQIPTEKAIYDSEHYHIVLVDAHRTDKVVERTDIKVRLCPYEEERPQPVMSSADAEPGEILILALRDVANQIESYAKERGYPILRRHNLAAFGDVLLVLDVVDGNIVDIIDEMREAFPNAEIDRNHHYHSSSAPRLYAPAKVKWPAAPGCLKNIKQISIGLIDGDIDQSHSAFKGQNIATKNFLENKGQPDRAHGTAIASILIGNSPESGYFGMLPGSKLYAATVLRKAPKGDDIATAEAVAQALDWMLKNKVRLINISLAGDKPNRVLGRVFEKTSSKGGLVFAAVGNNGPQAPPVYPASLKGVIAVTAIDAASHVYKQANRGAYVDFAAPGVDIWSAQDGGGGAYKSGTSYAVPHAVAVAAQNLLRNGSISHDLIVESMKQNTKDLGAPGHDKTYGWGLVSAQSDCER